MYTRRQFLKNLIAGAAFAALSPQLSLAAPRSGAPLLVALHLTGGNDALNTLVPHKDKLYKAARPHLALNSKKLLSVDSQLALHSSLKNLSKRFEDGQVLLVPGVGRPDHDRSHFRASDVWHGAGERSERGWMAQLAANLHTTPISVGPTVSQAVACPDRAPLGLLGKEMPKFPSSDKVLKAWSGMYRDWGGRGAVAERLKSSAAQVDDMVMRVSSQMDKVRLPQGYAGNDFGKRFELVNRLVASGFPAKVIHVSAGKFDTHSAQLGDHASQLAEFDAASHTFLANMENLDRPVVLLVYSEFGRRVAENNTGGTDHGAGGLAWLMGPGVKGGIQGGYDLGDLRDGDLNHSVDYRALYATAVETSFGKAQRLSLFPA